MDESGTNIQIGDDQYAITIRSTGDKTSYSGSLLTSRPDYMRQIDIKVPFDIKIKKVTPLTIFSRKSKLQKVSPGMNVTFKYSALDNSGNTVKKEKSYRFERTLIDGYTRNEKGEIFKGGQKINNPNDSLFVDNHKPLVANRQETFNGGILTRTADAPDIDEIFTDSEALTGRSKYDRVNVYLYNADKQKVDTAKRLGTITASDQKIKMNVNGEEVQGYNWSSETNDEEHEIESSVWARKDTPLYFTNQDVLSNSLENEKPVVEQVQAKVTFDLNGGTLPLDVKSYQGVDTKKLPGTEFAYVTSRAQETESLVRIAPMNEKFANQAGYVANGFEGKGATNKDHNGGKLAGDALALRKFAEEPSKQNLEFYGWTTKKVNSVEEYEKLDELTTQDQAVEVVAKAEAAKLKEEIDDLKKDAADLRAKGGTSAAKRRNEAAAKAIDEQVKILEARYNQVKGLASDKVYKFTKTSPIVSSMTVYAFYGPMKSAAYKGEQKYNEKEDKQYIEATPEDENKKASDDATYTLVRKTGQDAEGNPTYEELTVPVINIGGKDVFDITDKDSPVKHGDKIYIKTKEEGKPASYSTTPVTIDKKAPAITNKNGAAGITVDQDTYGYKLTVNATATDEDSGIYKLYVEGNDECDVEGNDECAYNDPTAASNTATINPTIKHGGQTVKVKVIAMDKFGNKAEIESKEIGVTKSELRISADVPYEGQDVLYIQTTPGAELTITVTDRQKNVKFKMTHTQVTEKDEVQLLNKDGSQFKLAKRDKVVITGNTDSTLESTLIMRAR